MGIACVILSGFLFRKKHPYWLLGLLILNAGVFCLYFSIIGRYFHPIRNFYYPYSSLIISIGSYIFFKNLQTSQISSLDRKLLLATLIEPILILCLSIGKLIDPDLSAPIWQYINSLSQTFGAAGDVDPNRIVLRFQMMFFHIFAVSYFVALYKLYGILKEAEARHLSFFCSDSFSYYKWIRRFWIIFVVIGLYAVCLVWGSYFIDTPPWLKRTLYIAMGIFGLGIFGLGIFTPLRYGKEKDFKSFIDHLEKVDAPKVHKESIAQQSPTKGSNQQIAKYKVQLTHLLEQDKHYRDPNLSLASLATLMDTSTRTVSRVINEGFSTTFFDLVNRYRIEEVKQHLLTENYAHYSILSIGLEAGYSSKSTFYSAFKKLTGLTPSQYRKQQS